MENKKIRVAITQGDTNGIGYELIFKTFETPEMLELCTPVVYGSPKVAAYHRKALDIETQFSIVSSAEEARPGRLNLLTCFDDEVKIELGKETEESAQAARRAAERAFEDKLNDAFDVLVALPQGKNLFADSQSYADNGLRMAVDGDLRIAFATDKMGLKDALAAITKDGVVKKATALFNTLRRDFSISNPRIAVLALNPDGAGEEERTIIKPAVDELNEKNIHAFGPYKAEELFAQSDYDAFDAILAMHYEQGALPSKTLSRGEGVTVHAGMPFVCTEVNAAGQAGKGLCDPSPLRYAIYAAIDIYRNRVAYDRPMGNPLPKLYHEKRDEGEKLRFSIPKKREAKE